MEGSWEGSWEGGLVGGWECGVGRWPLTVLTLLGPVKDV